MGIQVAPRISFRQMHGMGLGKSLSYAFVSGLFCKPNPSFLFCFVVFELLQCQVLIPYLFQAVFSYFYGSTNPFVHRVCHVNSFQPVCFFSSGSDHFNIRKIISQFPNVICFIRPKLSLFSRPPTLFLQGLRFLNQVSILLMRSLSIVFRQYSYPVILRKILTELQVYHSSFFSSPVDSIQAFSVDHILFLVSNAFSYWCTS